MGVPKLPTVGGYKIEISPKGSTDDQFDGAGRTGGKRDKNIRESATRTDERNVDPRKVKQEHDEKILQDAAKMKIGEDGHANEIKTIADQNARFLRNSLEKQLKK
jgi:hypothetical protein